MNTHTHVISRWAAALSIVVAGSACDGLQEPADPTASPPAPGLTGLTPSGPSSVTTPRLNGTSVEGSTVIIYGTADCTGAQLGQVEIDAAGTFSIPLSVALNAETPISANARRASGPLSPCSGALIYIHDDVAPEAPRLHSCSPTSPSNVNEFNLRGSAEADANLSIYSDAECSEAPVVESRTDDLLGAGVPVSVTDDSVNLFYARVRDAAGNQSPCSSEGFEFIEDSTPPPAPSLTGLSPSGAGSDPAPVASGTAEPASQVTLHADAACSAGALLGQGTAEELAGAGIPLSVPTNATTAVYGRATDEAGNPSDCVDTSLTYTHDDDAPDAPTLSSPALGAATTIALTGTAEPDASVELFTHDSCGGATTATTLAGTDGAFSFDVTISALNDANTYTVLSRDGAGLASACSAAVTYIHDDTPPAAPVITGFSPPPPSQTETAPAVEGTGEAGALVTLFSSPSCAGTALASDQVAADSGFSVPVSLPANTVSAVSAQQTDAAGNVSACSASSSWTHDDVAPSLTLLGMTVASSTSASLVYSALTDNLSLATEVTVQVCLAADSGGCEPFIASESATTLGDGVLELSQTLVPDTRYYAWARPVDEAGNVGAAQGPVSGRTLAAAAATGLAVGKSHTCVSTSDGAVACFGDDSSEQLGTPGPAADLAAAGETVSGVTEVVAVATGSGHSCALSALGAVSCWGDNALGQTGAPAAGPTAEPAQVDLGGVAAKQLVAGAEHTCALLVDSTVACWGRGTEGQLGDGNLTHSGVAVAPINASGIRMLASGDDHTCAVTTPGQVWCWGDDGLGQLGNGAAGSIGIAVQAEVGPVVSIGAGAHHTCAVLDSGAMRCWGDNSSSQLGAGLGAPMSDAPVDVQLMTSAVAVAGGDLHTCALQGDGDAFCWGDNTSGQLGDGTTTPQPLRTLVAGDHVFSGIAAGGSSTCAWASDGQAHCWGMNAAGNLGLGAGSDGLFSAPQAVTVEAPSAARRVVAGDGVSGAISTAGELWLWGNGDSGLKGDATDSDDSELPTTIPVSATGGLRDVGFGSNHACALDSAGLVHCWGSNTYGQVDGVASAQLLAPTDAGLPAAIALAVGKRHGCVVAQDRTVSCWGDNSAGQLGTGDAVAQSGAVAVPGVAGATDVAAGDDFSCACLADGTTVCWGTEDTGQLGLGGTSGALMGPFPTPGVSGALQIVAGAQHACVLTSTGGPMCWGSNQNGQLGHGAVNSIQTAAAVTAAGSATSLSAGAKHTCAARLGDQVRCWGWGALGQLGNGSATPSEVTPSAVALGSLSQVAAGGDHSCFMQADQSIRCAGANLEGQLGNPSAGISSADPVAAPVIP